MWPDAFPDPRTHEFPEWVLFDEYFYKAEDIVSFGQTLTADNVTEAYRKGIFPWYIEGVPLPWFCPERRAILDFSDLHVPRSLAKEKRKNKFTFTIDRDFDGVIRGCQASIREGQRGGTWITHDFIDVYTKLYTEGIVHSVEAWNADGKLVGGLYGVDAGGVFCGESMFFIEPNASKLALLFLIDHLRSRGSTWLDAQVMTAHMRALGAKEIDRREFLDKLKETQGSKLRLFDETVDRNRQAETRRRGSV
jgi:leucyl/phenylalanyl-tRNA--protein transferase